MDPSLERESPTIGDDLTDAQLGKLSSISTVWAETFAAHPSIERKGYANLRMVEKRYGRARVRDVFDYCIERRISPQGDSALPLVIALCKAQGGSRG